MTTTDTPHSSAVRPGCPRAWLLAARPKTLAGAVAPVLVALAAAWGLGFQWVPAILCMVFALLMQVMANFVNDLVDCLHGRDEGERLGPDRMCQLGLITTHDMKVGVIVTAIVACLVGLPLVLWGGWWTIAVGAFCLIFCVLYSTCLASLALGDVLVIVFFGLVPVCATFALQRDCLPFPVVLLSLAMGLVTDTLLLVNNLRDIHQDALNGKRTLAVLIGARATQILYLALPFVAVALCAIAMGLSRPQWVLLAFIVLPGHFLNYRHMCRLTGRDLNSILAHTSMGILLFAVTLSILLLSLK